MVLAIYVLFVLLVPARFAGIENFYIYGIYLVSGTLFIFTLLSKKPRFKYRALVQATSIYCCISLIGLIMAFVAGHILGRKAVMADYLEVFRYTFPILTVYFTASLTSKCNITREKFLGFLSFLGLFLLAAYVLTVLSTKFRIIMHSAYSVSRAVEYDVRYMMARPGLFFGNPNTLALFSATTGVIGWSLGKTFKEKAFFLSISSAIIVLSLSRAGAIGLLLGLIFYFLFLNNGNRLKELFIIAGALIFVCSAIIISLQLSKFKISDLIVRYTSAGGNLAGRTDIWAGLGPLINSSPILGIGLLKNEIMIVDNYYIILLLRGGILMVSAYLWWVMYFLNPLVLFRKNAKPYGAASLHRTLKLVVFVFAITDFAMSGLQEVRLSALYWTIIGIGAGTNSNWNC